MKELTIDQREAANGGGCTFASDLAVSAAAGAAGAIIGIASGGVGFLVGFAVAAFYSYGCHAMKRY